MQITRPELAFFYLLIWLDNLLVLICVLPNVGDDNNIHFFVILMCFSYLHNVYWHSRFTQGFNTKHFWPKYKTHFGNRKKRRLDGQTASAHPGPGGPGGPGWPATAAMGRIANLLKYRGTWSILSCNSKLFK